MTCKLPSYEKAVRKNIRHMITIFDNMLKKRVYPIHISMENNLEKFSVKPFDPPTRFFTGYRTISFTYNVNELIRRKKQ